MWGQLKEAGREQVRGSLRAGVAPGSFPDIRTGLLADMLPARQQNPTPTPIPTPVELGVLPQGTTMQFQPPDPVVPPARLPVPLVEQGDAAARKRFNNLKARNREVWRALADDDFNVLPFEEQLGQLEAAVLVEQARKKRKKENEAGAQFYDGYTEAAFDALSESTRKRKLDEMKKTKEKAKYARYNSNTRK